MIGLGSEGTSGAPTVVALLGATQKASSVRGRCVICVVGVFSSSEAALSAISMLRQTGFQSDRVGLLAPTNPGQQPVTSSRGLHSKCVNAPAIGPLMAAGTLVDIAQVPGAVAQTLTRFGVPGERAREHELQLQDGNAIVVISSLNDAGAARARAVFDSRGAISIS